MYIITPVGVCIHLHDSSKPTYGEVILDGETEGKFQGNLRAHEGATEQVSRTSEFGDLRSNRKLTIPPPKFLVYRTRIIDREVEVIGGKVEKQNSDVFLKPHATIPSKISIPMAAKPLMGRPVYQQRLLIVRDIWSHGFLSQGFELIIVGFEFLDLLLQLYDSILQRIECGGSIGCVVETVLESLGDPVHDLGDSVQLVQCR